MVTAEHHLAAEAGVEMLHDGGNAVDAAVAAAFVMGVVEPFTSGIGGIAGLVIRRPDGTVASIEGSTRAPLGARAAPPTSCAEPAKKSTRLRCRLSASIAAR